MVAVRVAEAEALVQRPGRRVVHLDLQEDTGEAALPRRLAGRRREARAKALAAVARVHLDRGERRPSRPATDSRAIASTSSPSLMLTNDCSGAEVSTFRATGGRWSWPR